MEETGKPLLHYIHPQHAVGDVHPFYWQGTVYLYYLKPGGRYEAALLRSDDLLHWEEAAISHEPDSLMPPQKPYFVLGVFYDAASGLFRSYFGSEGNVMRGSVSDDLLVWRAAGEACNIPAQAAYTVQRDPFVFWNEAESCYWAIMTSRKGGGNSGPHGGISYASSADLRHWTPRGDLFFPGGMGDPECPELFRMGDSWYLLYSAYDHRVGRPSYRVSAQPTGPWTACEPDCLDGSDLAAAQTVAAGGDRRLLFGWIPLHDTETIGHQYWGGHLALPREIYRLADGSLASRLEPGVSKRIRGERLGGWPSVVVEPAEEGWNVPGVYERIDMELDVLPTGACTQAVIRLLRPGAAMPTDVVWDVAGRRLVIATADVVHSDVPLRASAGRDDAAGMRLRLVIEADIVELFADDTTSLAARIPLQLNGFALRLASAGGAVAYAGVEVYRLKVR
ncbi:hypothetical protein [Paenibacillus cymbidii]|uniref:hypothetical protein n=1 Tax=Paenibacillus cymbidii TaxID=1639034 RepID=UPI001436BC6B|nr:hypothetical protein [Paenibacillus cymbidii]